MSYQAMTWAAAQRTGSPGAKAILQCIANYADEHGECWPSIGRLAFESEQSPDTVRRRLKDLESRGLIERVERYRSNGGRAADMFRLLMSSPAFAGEAPSAPLADCEGGADSEPVSATTPFATCCEGPPSQLCEGNMNHQNNHHTPHSPPVGGGVRSDDGSQAEESQADALADLFRDEPSVIIDLPAARRAWVKLSMSERAKALVGVPRYLDHCRKHRQKVRSPASYLRGRLWEQFAQSPAKAADAPRREADEIERAVRWAQSGDRSGWPFVECGTTEWAEWEAAFRHAGIALGRPARPIFAMMPDGTYGQALGRSFPMRRPPSTASPSDQSEAAE